MLRGAKVISGVVALLAMGGICCTSAADDPRYLDGQIIVDPDNPAWLARYAAGGDHVPFFMAGPGDPEGFLYRGSRIPDGTRDGDQVDLINKLEATGANCIYMQVVRSHGGDGASDHNPFVNPSDPSSGLNSAILNQWETWFGAMDDAGIVIYLFAYDDSAKPFDGTHRTIGTAEVDFMEGIVNRFEHHKNLIWNVSEEYQEGHSAANVSQLASIIRNADDHDHPIAVHQLGGLTFDFPNDPNIDQFAIQRNVAGPQNIHQDMVTAWHNAAGRYNLNMSESNQHYDPASPDRTATRNYSWAAAMGGAYVMVFRDDIASTPISVLKDHGRIVNFFEATNFNEMAPHDELALEATQYILADPGNSYILFGRTPSRQDLGVKDLVEGIYDLRWFDPVTGAWIVQNNVPLAAGDQAFALPPGIGTEVALHIRDGVGLEPTPVVAWEFNTDGDQEGWTNGSDVNNNGVSGGTWDLVMSGVDPKVFGPTLRAPADLATVVEIGMSSTDTNTRGKFFWTVEGDADFSAERSQAFTILNDGQIHSYRFDFSHDSDWTDTITGLRLDPVASGHGGDVSIDFVRILALLPLGDVNLDGELNGLDVEPFVDVLLGGLYQHGADMNGDGHVNGLDVDPFVAAVLGRGGLVTTGGYQAEADMNEDDAVNGLDVDSFVAAVVGGGVQAVPEPSTLILLALGLSSFVAGHFSCRRRRRATTG
jgi:hypothetical protein